MNSTSRPHQQLPFQSAHPNTEFLHASPDPNRHQALTPRSHLPLPLLLRRPSLPAPSEAQAASPAAASASRAGAGRARCQVRGCGQVTNTRGRVANTHTQHIHVQLERSDETHTSLRDGKQSGAHSRQRAISQQPPSRQSSLPGQVAAGGRLHARTNARTHPHTHRDPSPSAVQRPQRQRSKPKRSAAPTISAIPGGAKAAPRRTHAPAAPSCAFACARKHARQQEQGQGQGRGGAGAGVARAKAPRHASHARSNRFQTHAHTSYALKKAQVFGGKHTRETL